jgi:hypothetical protein
MKKQKFIGKLIACHTFEDETVLGTVVGKNDEYYLVHWDDGSDM